MSRLIDESDNDPIDFTEEIERSWRLYLKAFETEVYPMFKEHGLQIGEALILWESNRIKNAIAGLANDKEEEDGS